MKEGRKEERRYEGEKENRDNE
jgi:hypothetical protein